MLARLLAAYRRTGADPPFGDPVRAHGIGMEGYYWRLTDHAAGRVVVAICGVARADDGPWAMVILAAHPPGFVRVATTRTAWADRGGSGCGRRRRWSRTRAAARGPRRRRRLDVTLGERSGWPRRAFGALGVAQAVPGLHQYWHPHLLGGRAAGHGAARRRGGRGRRRAYAEKNWGAAFSDHWWWGQAFPEPDVCVAFAGGRIRLGRWARRRPRWWCGWGQSCAARPAWARMVAAASDGAWRVRGRSPRFSLLVEGEADDSRRPRCPSRCRPSGRSSRARARCWPARLAVTLRRGRRLVYRGESSLAGLEHGTTRPAPGEPRS